MVSSACRARKAETVRPRYYFSFLPPFLQRYPRTYTLSPPYPLRPIPDQDTAILRMALVARLVLAFILASLGGAARPPIPAAAFKGRDIFCQVPCGGGWCCQQFEVCQPATGGDTPYQCSDDLLHTTFPADDVGSLLSIVSSTLPAVSSYISSLAWEHSLTLTFTSQTTFPFTPPQTATPTTSSGQASGPSTQSTTTRPTTTNSALSSNAAQPGKKPTRLGIGLAALFALLL